MKFSRKHLFFTAAAVAILLMAVYAALGAIARRHTGEVQEELGKVLGGDAGFDALEAKFWGGIGFSVGNFRIADNPRFAATPLVQSKELRFGVSLWHLLGGRLVIDSLTFTEPEFQVITNEESELNIASFAQANKSLSGFPRFRAAAGGGKDAPVSFLLTRLRVIDGRVDFIDRSVSSPAELRINHINLDVGELNFAARAKMTLTATLADGLGRDLRIEGEMGPFALGRSWSQQPVNLAVNIDSLYLPLLARAIPYLRDRIPRELDITGPMSFHTNVSGTLQQPRFTEATLKVPFLGSPDYNAVLEGSLRLTGSRKWQDAAVRGSLTLNAIGLAQLRKLPVLQRILPAGLVTEGSLNLHSRFEGPWNRLRIGALVEIPQGHIEYPGWLRMPADEPLSLRAQFSRHEGGLTIHRSELKAGGKKLAMTGAVTEAPAAQLRIQLQAPRAPLQSWEPLLGTAPIALLEGEAQADITLERPLAAAAEGWAVHGQLQLNRAAVSHRASGRSLRLISGTVNFSGRSARTRNLALVWGATPLLVSLDLDDIAPLRGRYGLRARDLDLADVPQFDSAKFGRLKDVVSTGSIGLDGDQPRLDGQLAFAEGALAQIPVRNFSATIAWSLDMLRLTDLKFSAFRGEVTGRGFWLGDIAETRELHAEPRAVSLDLGSVAARLAPELEKRLGGDLDVTGEMRAAADMNLPQSLEGRADARVRNGIVRDFNLISQLFYRAAKVNQAAQAMARLPKEFARIVDRKDTPLEEAKATVIMEKSRLRSNNLQLVTPDYTITATGWIDLGGAIQWHGHLILAPKLTQALQRDHKAVRYFLDRKGRLSVAFRLDGKLPAIRIRPENRALAQVFRWGTWQRGDGSAKDESRKEKNWLPDPLERLLHR